MRSTMTLRIGEVKPDVARDGRSHSGYQQHARVFYFICRALRGGKALMKAAWFLPLMDLPGSPGCRLMLGV